MRPAALGLLLLLLGGCSALSWRGRDQTAFVLNVGCRAVDVAQTSWALSHGYAESNPLYGSDPSDTKLVAIEAASAAVVWWAAEENPAYRTAIIVATALPCAASVVSNYRIGARP